MANKVLNTHASLSKIKLNKNLEWRGEGKGVKFFLWQAQPGATYNLEYSWRRGRVKGDVRLVSLEKARNAISHILRQVEQYK